VLRAGGDPGDAATALAACGFPASLLDDPALRDEAATAASSRVSVHPGVRAALLERQRAFAAQPGGAVLDGRDIGTVIAPNADAKLFVTARSEIRAQRRERELALRGVSPGYDAVLADILARDARDSGRDAAPLRQAEDADLLDTSDLDIGQAIQRAVALVENRVRRAG
jgi:cytidylate kinase